MRTPKPDFDTLPSYGAEKVFVSQSRVMIDHGAEGEGQKF